MTCSKFSLTCYDRFAAKPGYFLAQVVDESMNRRIPNGCASHSNLTFSPAFPKTADLKRPHSDGRNLEMRNLTPFITLKGIPLAAHDYVVNGKPALEWVMERQSVTTDKASGITNDANLWATETMGDPKYPLELFLRVVTVGLETMKIVNGLPGLEIESK
jgi:hypothetical protein